MSSPSFYEHLDELHKRLLLLASAFLAGTIIGYIVSPEILKILISPLKRPLIYLSPQGAFVAKLKASLLLGAVFSFPFLLWQFWGFVSPGLKPLEKKYFLRYSFPVILLFAGGLLFSYFIALPIGLKFLISQGGTGFQPMISLEKYFSFVSAFILAFGILFEFPILLLLLVRIGILSHETLKSKRRHAIVIIFILAAAFTPGPDIFSQFLLAIPLIILYEITLLLTRITA